MQQRRDRYPTDMLVRRLSLHRARPTQLGARLHFGAIVALLAGFASAQNIDQARESARQAANAARYPLFLSVMSDFGETSRVNFGKLKLNGTPDTSLTSLAVPWRHDFAFKDSKNALHVEATAGYVSTRLDDADLWGGNLPGLETRTTSRTTAYALDVGIGPSLYLPDQGLFQPLLHLGLAHLENDTNFDGPGAAVTRALTDGVLFNWDGLYGFYGASLALRPKYTMFNHVRATPLLRYDLRVTDGLDVDDSSLDNDETTQWATLRVDFMGPTNLKVGDEAIRWHADVGYRYLFGETIDVMGFDDLYEITLGLESVDAKDIDADVGRILLTGGMQFADDTLGWTLGLAIRF